MVSAVSARLFSIESTCLDVLAVQFWWPYVWWKWKCQLFIISVSRKRLNPPPRSTILKNPPYCFYRNWRPILKSLLTFGHRGNKLRECAKLRVSGAFVPYLPDVLTCFTCLRAFASYVPSFFYVPCMPSFSYVPSFIYVPYVSPLVMCLTCLYFLLFFTCLTCLHFFKCLHFFCVPSFFASFLCFTPTFYLSTFAFLIYLHSFYIPSLFYVTSVFKSYTCFHF